MRQPVGRLGRPEEIAALALYLASDESAFTTGTTHVARAEEWPIMPTEWVHALLKPWNFFDETPTLGKKKDEK